ncbi:DUF2141 domain-containing protein [Marinicellulosiphila megalodicopiae]|uniref:DUF2141 domain-containing protein n=1 Tax=Marinicellulosiphila megalodicopiae TaxID=2724896 RepID=UPI003BB1C807
MNKLIILLTITLLASFGALAQDNVTITIDIKGATYQEGQIMCALFDNDDSFLKDAVREMTVQIDENNQAFCVFDGLPKGEYAATAIYDLDSNGEMKTNFIGLPKEPVGLSNKHRPRFGPPKFKKAKQQVDGDHVFDIDLENA